MRIPSEPWLEVFAPQLYHHASLATFEITDKNKQLYNAAKGWVERFCPENTKTGLLLHGTPGVGKTHLAYAIGDALSKKGHWAYCTNWVDLLAKIKQSWNSGALSEEAIKSSIKDAQVAIIDDLGSELISKSEQDWVTERLYEILNHRLAKQLPTIVTSNLNMDALAKRYSGRIASRLAEMCRPVWCEADDYRIYRGKR